MRSLGRKLACGVAVVVAALAAPGGARGEAEDAPPEDPRAVVRRAFENLYGYNAVQRVEIRSRDADGEDFVRRVQVVRRGAGAGLNRMLLRFLGPGRLRGIGLLLLERPDGSYDAFLYQPAYRRVRRVSLAQRGDAFFGTDLTFEDLEAKRADQWRVRALRRESLAGRETFVIELRPGEARSAYDRVVAWFDRELPVMLRAEFYRSGGRAKVMEVDPGHITRVDGHFVPSRLTFHGGGDSSTVVVIPEVELRDELPEETFSTTALEFGDPRRDAR